MSESSALADTDPPAGTEAPAGTDAPTETQAPAETDVPPETNAPVATEPPAPGDAIESAPAGLKGGRSDPVPAGQIADIGEGFRLQVLSVTDDATQAVMTENQFNDPPPEGSRFTIIEVELGYYGFDDPQSGFVTSLQAVGSENTELDAFACGVIPNELDQFSDTFSGAVRRGNICFVTTPADSGAVQLYAAVGFTGDDVFLDASATPAETQEMPTIRGIQPGTASEEVRTNPAPMGTSADVGDGWTVTVVAPAADITDAVLAENQFNEPPPEGFRFVGVPLSMAYAGSETANPFAVTIKSVGDSNVEYTRDCGVIPGEIDAFSDVFDGGVVEGQLCFVVPADDIGTITLYAGALFEDQVFFAVS